MKKTSKALGATFIILLCSGLFTFLNRSKLFQYDFYYAGTLEATRVDVPARVNSVISAIAVQEGDSVSLHQSLMMLSCEDLKIAADITNKNANRFRQLYQHGSQTREAFDLMMNRQEEANLRVSWCNVKSPLTGTVLNRYHEVGEMVNPGTRLFTLANLSEPYAYFYLPQPVIAQIKIGMAIQGILPEIPGQKFEGKIINIGSEAEFTPKNVQTREERTRLVYAIKVAFTNPDGILKPGMTVEMKLPER